MPVIGQMVAGFKAFKEPVSPSRMQHVHTASLLALTRSKLDMIIN